MSERTMLSRGGAISAIARLSLKRLMRGRSLWVGAAFCLLPLGIVFLSEADRDSWDEVIGAFVGMLAIVPPLFMASALAEEIQERTFTYLWTRPIDRWTVIAGKLLAYAPLIIVMFVASLAVAAFITYGSELEPAVLLRGSLALALGVIAFGAFATGVGSLVPKQATATAIAYLLIVDAVIGAIPLSIANLALSHHVNALAESLEASNILWLAGMTTIWLAIAFWRVNRIEPKAGK